MAIPYSLIGTLLLHLVKVDYTSGLQPRHTSTHVES